MGFGSNYFRAIGLVALLSVSSNAQTTNIEYPPIFSEERQKLFASSQQIRTINKEIVQTVENKELPITVEPIVPVTSELRSKGDNYRHVANQIDFLAVYMKKRVGGESRLGESSLSHSFGLRWVEPTYEFRIKNIVGSNFVGEIETRPGKPLEAKITKPLPGGEMGAYCTVDRHGRTNVYAGVRGDLSRHFWRSFLTLYRKH